MKFKVSDRVRVKDGVSNAGQEGQVIRVHGFRPSGVTMNERSWPYGVLLDGRAGGCGFEEHELELVTSAPPAAQQAEMVNNPAHYGGADNPYEVYKVLEAWGLTRFAYLWNCIKYIARAEKKNNALEDLRKARWYLDREIAVREAAQREKA